MNRNDEQYFNIIFVNRGFNDKHVYEFMPNPSIGAKADKKKILGGSIENFGDNQVALCLKCYTIWNKKEDRSSEAKSLKLIGISLKKNLIESSDYLHVIQERTVKPGIKINFQMIHY